MPAREMPTGKVVLVVGASSGIGAATAELLCAHGNKVVGVSRNGDGLAGMATRLAGFTAEPADVLDAAALVAIVGRLVAAHGRLDAVVHTAQTMAYGTLEEVPADVFEHVVDTAIHGTANLARAVMPQLRRQGSGVFVIVNSLLGQIATPRMGAYDTGKWGQLGLARVLRLEARDCRGIAICTVSPGAVNTPIYRQAGGYVGKGGFPPPPVQSPAHLAGKIVRLLDRPRRHTRSGPANLLTIVGFQLLPGIFERIVGPLVGLAVFRGKDVPNGPGNVFVPDAGLEAVEDGWSALGTRRRRS